MCEFIPQMIFLNLIFGYLCILIVIKWVSGKLTDLYHVMIYMFLSPGKGSGPGRSGQATQAGAAYCRGFACVGSGPP